MKVCVFGVGRSGTTAVYSMLQQVMLDNFSNKVDFVYEPFLWDRQSFNDVQTNVFKNFLYQNSVSAEGIYNHLKLPLFIDDPQKYKDNTYLKSLFSLSNDNQGLLIKMIRACGRFKLFQMIDPSCKFIFILRNPIDVINSVISRFSFYGGEFHKDDFSRFLREVNNIFGQDFKENDNIQEVEKQVLYWYYMNLFALRSFDNASSKPLIICYEDFINKIDKYNKIITNYLGFQPKDEYTSFTSQKHMHETNKILLNREEVEILKPYLHKYLEMLKPLGVSIREDSVLKRYTNLPETSMQKGITTNLTAVAMNAQINDLKKQLNEANIRIGKMKSELDSIYNPKTYSLAKKIAKLPRYCLGWLPFIKKKN